MESTKSRTSPTHIVGLDFIRFGAAIAVMLFHLTFSGWAAPGAGERFGSYAGLTRSLFGEMFSFGWIGVEIFFVLSGFVIAISAENATAYSFLRSRALRLLPVMWICSAILIPVLIAEGGSAIGISFRFLSSLGFQPLGPWMSVVYWTLQVEIAFYACVFLLIRFSDFSRVTAFAFVLAAVSSAFWSCYFLFPSEWLKSFVETQASSVLLVQHGCLFALGIGLWLIRRHGMSMKLAMLCAISTFGCFLEIAHQSHEASARFKLPVDLSTPMVVWAVSVGLICLSVWSGWNPSYARFARIIGLTTFPLYLVHERIGVLVLRASESLGFVGWPTLTLAMIVPLILSTAVALFAEPPVRRIMDDAVRNLRAWLAARSPELPN